MGGVWFLVGSPYSGWIQSGQAWHIFCESLGCKLKLLEEYVRGLASFIHVGLSCVIVIGDCNRMWVGPHSCIISRVSREAKYRHHEFSRGVLDA